MNGRLEGRVALITGAGRGIGRAIALKLGREGARLVLNDLDEAPLLELAHELGHAGTQVATCSGSVSDPGFAQRFVGIAVDRFAGIDIIINNAGYTWDNVIQKMDDEQWQTMLEVHLTAPFRVLRAAQPVLRAAHRADVEAGRVVYRKVVNISSITGIGGNAGQINYAAAKAGVIGMTKVLAKEWGRLKVNVNCVAFGLIRTRLSGVASESSERLDIEGHSIRVGVNPDTLASIEHIIPLGGAGTPEQAAGAVYLFCCPESDYISGETLVCAGGLNP